MLPRYSAFGCPYPGLKCQQALTILNQNQHHKMPLPDKNCWLIFVLGLWPLLALPQKCDATLCGTVTDAESLSPIPFAEVIIQEKNLGVVTDENGKFHFHNLCEGSYTIVSQHIGCPHVAKEVFIKGNVEVNFSLHHEGLHLEEIVVMEKSMTPVLMQTERSLAGIQLDVLKGATLGDALQNLPGVTTLRTGSSIAKPVIRGLHSNRVLVLNNGVRQEGQQWGLDHGPEIDPYIADEVKVVMGANSVRYGADALGGVVLVNPRPLREKQGYSGPVRWQHCPARLRFSPWLSPARDAQKRGQPAHPGLPPEEFGPERTQCLYRIGPSERPIRGRGFLQPVLHRPGYPVRCSHRQLDRPAVSH